MTDASFKQDFGFKHDPGRLMTWDEVADFLGVEKETPAKWRETGRVDLPFVKLGLKEIRYRYGDKADCGEHG